MLDRIINLPAPVRYALFGVIAVAMIFLGVTTAQSNNDPAAGPGDTSSTEGDTNNIVVDPPNFEAEPQENPTVGGATNGVRLELGMPVEDADLKNAAETTVEFTKLFTSYKYNQNDQEKKSDLSLLVLETNALDLDAATPTGEPQAFLTRNKTAIAVVVTAVEAILISPTSIGMRVTATSTTTTDNADPVVAERSYAVTLNPTESGSQWKVSEFSSLGDDSPFLDDTGGE